MEFLSLEILDFIEELAEKYNLDKELENDPLVKENLSEAESIGEKQFIKILYSKDVFPSFILKDIIKNYLNKNLHSSQLQKEIKEKLLIEEEVATQIFQDISNNTLISETLEVPIDVDATPVEKKVIKTGLSQELE